MTTFSRGQKGKLADLGTGHTFNVDVDIAANGASVDVSCFGLDAGSWSRFTAKLARPGDWFRRTAPSGLASWL